MKQIIILMMLVASQAIGQVYYSLETGVVDSQTAIMEDSFYINYDMNKYLLYSDIMLGYRYKKIHIQTSLINTFDKSESVYFKPLLTRYDFKVYYKYKKIQIGYEHSCTHPIYNKITTSEKTLYRNSYDKFFIRYEFYQ